MKEVHLFYSVTKQISSNCAWYTRTNIPIEFVFVDKADNGPFTVAPRPSSQKKKLRELCTT